MKKLLILILSALTLLYVSNRIYQYYSRNYVNSHEAIVLLNNFLDEREIDLFFQLEAGTFDPERHKVVFGLVRKDGSVLEYYINLPAKRMTGFNFAAFDCDEDYQELRHFHFYKYEIGNKHIVARVIDKEANSRNQMSFSQTIASKELEIDYEFGRINVLDIHANGISKHCN